MHPFTPVIPTQYDSKTDWQIWQGVAAELASRGLVYQDTVPNGDTITRDLGYWLFVVAGSLCVAGPPADEATLLDL